MNRTRTEMGRKVGVSVTLLLLFSGSALYAQTAASALPPGDGKDLTALVCTQCHGLRATLLKRASPEAWKKTVGNMVMYGAELLPEEADLVTQYLAKNFGPRPSASGGGAQAQALPAGDGKALVASRCTTCHDLSRIMAPQRTKEDWAGIVKAMVDLGTVATPEEMQTITSYLTAQFGRKAE